MEVKNYFTILLMAVFLINLVSAADIETERQQRLNFGHVLLIGNISTEPAELVPGQQGKLRLTIKNTGNFQLNDLRVQIDLPSDIAFLNDISKRKIPTLASLEEKNLEYDIIVLPGSSEGIAKLNITTDYLNHIGDERQDVDNFGIKIKSVPKFYVSLEESTIYQGRYLGEVTITFTNNDLGDVKFLDVELQKSPDYDIVPPIREYVGDLDSDDFESVEFRINVKSRQKEVVLPLKVNYRDSLNNEYSENMNAYLYMRTPAEAGIKSNTTTLIVVGILVLAIAGYIFYRKYRRKKNRLNGLKRR